MAFLVPRRGGRADTPRQEAFLATLGSEHVVLQIGAKATVNRASIRATPSVMALSSSLVAMGFAAQSREILVPFVATVMPARPPGPLHAGCGWSMLSWKTTTSSPV
jgi:hypothetical protein